MTKRELFDAGVGNVTRWCDANNAAVRIVESEEPKRYGVCGYYRSGVITISVDACAAVGRAGRQWSYPGYSVDRTPYGVLAHELGHHTDRAHGTRPGEWSSRLRNETGELALTGYAPNANEWFAEMFRLFVTNPSLLAALRPLTYAQMATRWRSVETRPWREVLAGAERQLAVCEKRVAHVARAGGLYNMHAS